MSGRPSSLFLTWQRHSGRAEEIADAVGGTHRQVFFPWLASGYRVLLRYVLSCAVTAGHLARHRPRAVIVTNPPVVPGVVVGAYAALSRTAFVLDSHPTAFGAKDHAMSRRLLPVHRFLARRAAAVMVTTSEWVAQVRAWGGHGIVVHEAPPRWQVAPPREVTGRPRVLFVGVFGGDEPVDAVVAAARLLPHVDVHVTGDPRRCPEGLRRSLPGNVTLVGYLDRDSYRRAVEEAHVLLTLTTEPTSVMRAGYEAVYARRPLVVSDWPTCREVFPHAEHTGHEPARIAEALQRLLDRGPDVRRLDEALETQQRRWRDQVAALRVALGMDPVDTTVSAGTSGHGDDGAET